MKLSPRFVSIVCSLAVLAAVSSTPVAAQNQNIDPAFSSEKIDTYDLPEFEIAFNGSGFDVPTELVAGYHVVTQTAGPNAASYAALMQPPAGLSEADATAIALNAAANDVVEEGWVFGGGSYALPGSEVKYILDLEPGEWKVAASWQPEGEDAVETLELYPLTVTAAEGTPAATVVPEADVTMELNDVAFGGLDGPIAAGPTLFDVTNVGAAPRQMVLFRTSTELTSEDFERIFASFETGTPDAMWEESVWVGYTALASPGHGTMIELDLEPGIYTATSWVIDPETGAPALLLGMVQSFTVE